MSYFWVHGELIGMRNKQTNPTSENLPKWNLLNLLRAVPELDTESSSVTALPLFLFCRNIYNRPTQMKLAKSPTCCTRTGHGIIVCHCAAVVLILSKFIQNLRVTSSGIWL